MTCGELEERRDREHRSSKDRESETDSGRRKKRKTGFDMVADPDTGMLPDGSYGGRPGEDVAENRKESFFYLFAVCVPCMIPLPKKEEKKKHKQGFDLLGRHCPHHDLTVHWMNGERIDKLGRQLVCWLDIHWMNE